MRLPAVACNMLLINALVTVSMPSEYSFLIERGNCFYL